MYILLNFQLTTMHFADFHYLAYTYNASTFKPHNMKDPEITSQTEHSSSKHDYPPLVRRVHSLLTERYSS